MPKALTCTELDSLSCTNPDCDHKNHGNFYLHAACHDRGLEVHYEIGSGVLVVSCAVCSKMVTEIAVAKGGFQWDRNLSSN